MKNLLITGGAGFVGSNQAISFKRDYPSWNIISLDNLYRRGADLTLPRLRQNGVKFVHGDIRIIDALECIGAFDLMIECSAEPSVLAGYGNSPVYLNQTNLAGFLNCLEICRRRNADMLFLSTSRVYPMEMINRLEYLEKKTRFTLAPDLNLSGVSAYGFNEDFPLTGVRSIYGATKLCAELMLQEYIAAYKFRGIINRCGVLTGPWQMGKTDQGFVGLWMARHLWRGSLSYIGYKGQGKQVRDILHIDDLYDLLRIQIKRLDELNGSIFNVGGGQANSVSLSELTTLCQEITGNKIDITSDPETRTADIPYYISDNRRVCELTGWKPRKSIDLILSDIYAWLCRHEEMLRPILN
jgi:CDP-paratose 2-epimerase